MSKKTILIALSAGILFLSCSLTDGGSGRSGTAETKQNALRIIQPVIDKYLEAGEVSVSGTYAEDLGDGTLADLPDLSFVSDEAETRFNSECVSLLRQELKEDFSDLCDETVLDQTTGQGRYTTYYSKKLEMGGSLGTASIKIVRYWVLKYFIYFEVTGLKTACDYMQISLTTSFGETKTKTIQHEKEIKLYSKRYSSSEDGSYLKPIYATLEYYDMDLKFNSAEGIITLIE